MKRIFEQGDFSQYRVSRIDSARAPIVESRQYGVVQPTVFLSHKHDDLEDLKGIIGLLESKYGVRTYIDSQDPSMPTTTSGETAKRIKSRIQQCKKFILLATNKAVESKWCNWELGFGDAKKYPLDIAIFPMKPQGFSDSAYKGNEYLSIYPHVIYSPGMDFVPYKAGFYVETKSDNGTSSYIELGAWLKR